MKRLLLLILFVCATITSVSSKSIGKIYVVSVGISDYKNIQDLNLPEQDAKDIANLYKTKTKHVILITGRYATKSRILQSLRDQFTRANENDMVVPFSNLTMCFDSLYLYSSAGMDSFHSRITFCSKAVYARMI